MEYQSGVRSHREDYPYYKGPIRSWNEPRTPYLTSKKGVNPIWIWIAIILVIVVASLVVFCIYLSFRISFFAKEQENKWEWIKQVLQIKYEIF